MPDVTCIPGMGVHWIDFELFDTRLDPNQPEVVLFMPDDASGDPAGDTFVAIEYVVVTEGTAHNTTQTVPVFMGERLDGPMPGHFPGMPWHAELHVYVIPGSESPDGFPGTNPAVSCP